MECLLLRAAAVGEPNDRTGTCDNAFTEPGANCGWIEAQHRADPDAGQLAPFSGLVDPRDRSPEKGRHLARRPEHFVRRQGSAIHRERHQLGSLLLTDRSNSRASLGGIQRVLLKRPRFSTTA